MLCFLESLCGHCAQGGKEVVGDGVGEDRRAWRPAVAGASSTAGYEVGMHHACLENTPSL